MTFVCLYIFQNEAIYPLEASIRSDGFASIASLVYLPHGLKVFCALVLGIWSLPLIFVAQTFNSLYFNGSLSFAVFASSFLAVVSIGVPIALFARVLKQPIENSPLEANTLEISSFWLFVAFAFSSSMLNSLLQTLVYGLPNTALSWYFLFGDIIGSVAFFAIVATSSFFLNRFIIRKKKAYKL